MKILTSISIITLFVCFLTLSACSSSNAKREVAGDPKNGYCPNMWEDHLKKKHDRRHD